MISVSLEGSDIPGLRALSVHEEDGLHKPTSLTSQILKSAKKKGNQNFKSAMRK